MRKFIAVFTSLCLAFSMLMLPAMAFAATSETLHPIASLDADNASADSAQNDDGGSASGELLPLNKAQAELSAKTVDISQAADAPAQGGIVDITLTTLVSPEQGEGVSARLIGKDGAPNCAAVGFTRKQSNDVDIAEGYYCRIDNVAAGNYQLKVDGAKYATYTQDLAVGDGSRIALDLVDTGHNSLYTSKDKLKMGLLPYGDFDNNGTVDALDAQKFTEAVANFMDSSNADPAYDLDASSSIDAADLQFFALNMDAKVDAVIRNTKDVTQMVPDCSEVEVGGGSITDLFIDNGVIPQLKPKADEATGVIPDISEDTPVVFSVEPRSNTSMEGMSIKVPTDSEGTPTEGKVLVDFEDGTRSIINFYKQDVNVHNAVAVNAPLRALANMKVRARADLGSNVGTLADGTDIQTTIPIPQNGVMTIDFGKQIPVKMVTIRISATSSNKLAEIAKVEFLNGMEDAIPAPELNIPKNIKADAGDKKIDIAWGRESNVTGYQVDVAGANGTRQTFDAPENSLSVESIGGKKLKNGIDYTIKVRSVSEGWFSPWSNPIVARPLATKVPNVVDGINLSPGFTDIGVSWKEAEDAETYIVYWKEAAQSTWQQSNEVSSTSYAISGLKSGTKYQVQVQSKNTIGVAPKSAMCDTETKAATVKVPWYNLINRTAQNNVTGQSLESHIANVEAGNKGNNSNINPNFKGYTDIVDGDYSTYWFEDGNWSNDVSKGPIVTFDKAYEMDHLLLTTYLGNGYSNFAGFRVNVWSEGATSPTKYYSDNGQVSVSGVNGASNTLKISFPKSSVKKIQVSSWHGSGSTNFMSISEMAFYEYTPLYSEIKGLWADDLCTVLKDDVSQAKLDDLRTRLDTPDPLTMTSSTPQGELSPDYAYYDRELNNAQDVMDHKSLGDPVRIDSSLDKTQNNYAGGTNAWLPLGVSAKKGDKLSFYLGNGTNNKSGSAVRIWIGQQHAEYSKPAKVLLSTVALGLNTVEVPDMIDQSFEEGGTLYAEYVSSDKNQVYNLRVEGGTKVPVLELHGITDEGVRSEKILDYVNELGDYVNRIESIHNAEHKAEYGNYQEQKCTANMTDIGIDYLMYSVPASQIWAGLVGSTNEEKAQNLGKALKSADDAMILFYQHKGLSNLAPKEGDTAAYSPHGLPKSRQNVRYTQMFAGAFMYASGNHIGIQWGSCTGPISITNFSADENGMYKSGRLFGWGLNHEIGHEINQGAYAVAETTNNYYAQLAQSHDSTETTRWTDYENVYNKVTSGRTGFVSGKSGIAMYWQLHLAYDGHDYMESTGKKSYNYKTYDNYTDLFNNLIFARIDSYARDPKSAPTPQGIALDLKTECNTDQAIIRLATAAAQKDLRPYFRAWGLVANATTDAYCSQFEEETRGIQYITDETRLYQFDNFSQRNASAPSRPDAVSANYNYGENTVSVNLSGCPKGDNILGYEVLRDNVPVGFVTAEKLASGETTFTDTINTVNNRLFTYTVKAVDKFLKRSEPATAGVYKVHHDNILAKDKWSIETDLRDGASDGKVDVNDDGDMDFDASTSTVDGSSSTACTPAPESTALNAHKIIDGNKSNTFNGSGSASDASVTINFGENLEITAVRCYLGDNVQHPTSGLYAIELSNDGNIWEQVDLGKLDIQGNCATFYLDDGGSDRLFIYDANYLRVTALDQTGLSISEIDVLGPTGDDIELSSTGMGYLEKDTVVGENEDGAQVAIPAGSLVFTGTYQGNPAYNAVILYDYDKLVPGSERPQNSAMINDVFHQVIFGERPVDGELPDVKSGYWVCYITPDEMGEGFTLPKNICAELYRVDDAITMEGQRRVADSDIVAVPPADVLSNQKIEFTFDIEQFNPQTSPDEPTAANSEEGLTESQAQDNGGAGNDDQGGTLDRPQGSDVNAVKPDGNSAVLSNDEDDDAAQ